MPGFLPPFLRGDLKPHWLYARWVRSVPWANTTQRLQNYAVFVSIATVVLVATGGLMGYGSGAEGATITIVLAIAGFMFIIVDFASVLFGIATAREHISKFDLLRMSPIPPELLTETLQQVALTRAWRVLVVMQAIRMAIVTGVFTFGIMLVVFMAVITFGAGAIWIVSLVALALGEPVWRIKLTTALGVMAGVTVEGTTSQWGIGFGMLLLLWLAQGIVALLPFAILLLPVVTDNDGAIPFFLWLTITLPLMTWGIRRVQHRVCDYCLARVSRHIVEPAV
ncbi:MAG: hypothetical protein AAFV33_13255 [Chloroflexota bacterium]